MKRRIFVVIGILVFLILANRVVSALPECNDGIDNDLDGLIDFPDDLGCKDIRDRYEINPQCSDGIDNDLDGSIDYLNDSGCDDYNDNDESVVLGYANGCLAYGDKLQNVFGDVRYACWSTSCYVCVLMTETGNYSTAFTKCEGLPKCGFGGGNESIGVDLAAPNLTINSPVNGGVYNSRNVIVDLGFNEPASIYYKDNTATRENWKRLCSNCDDSYTKGINFAEGLNNITIRAEDRNDNSAEEVRVFRVDSKNPRVTKAYPTKGFASGLFEVEFNEENPEALILHYGVEGDFRSENISIADSCNFARTKVKCFTTVDLSDFDGGEIEYYFELIDIAGVSDESKHIKLDVDTTDPIIEELNYEVDGKYVSFDILIDEPYFDKLGYSYVDSRGKVKEKSLCSKLVNGRCEKRITFTDGPHNITIFVLDKVGHLVGEGISFFTDSKNPKILKTYPKKGLVSGEFSVEFMEANPKELILYYGIEGAYETKNVDLVNDCYRTKKDYCDTSVDLEGYDGEEIKYYFTIKDKVNNTYESKPLTLTVDTSDPVLNNPDSFWTQGEDRYNRYIYFSLNITEENFDEVSYVYTDSRGRLKEKTICSRLRSGLCETRKSFGRGNQSLNIQITDKAGNAISTELVEFEVI